MTPADLIQLWRRYAVDLERARDESRDVLFRMKCTARAIELRNCARALEMVGSSLVVGSPKNDEHTNVTRLEVRKGRGAG